MSKLFLLLVVSISALCSSTAYSSVILSSYAYLYTQKNNDSLQSKEADTLRKVEKKDGSINEMLLGSSSFDNNSDSVDRFGISIKEVKKRIEKDKKEEYLILSRLYPKDFMKIRSGEYVVDSVFSHYSMSQIEFSFDTKIKRRQYLKSLREKASSIAINIIKKFFEEFPDTRSSDDILIRYMELIYESFSVAYKLDKNVYDYMMSQYYRSNEYLSYKNALKEYYTDERNLNDSLELRKPIQPKPPDAPDPRLDELIEIYDQVLNNIKDEKYLPHVLFAKAFVLGERYKDYKIIKNLKNIDIDQKRQEAISILEQLLRKYPESEYTVASYLLIGEYLFNSIRRQPRRTIESIPYYRTAIQYIVERNLSKKYYERVLYKLAWAYFRVDNYKEARTWFNYLMEDIEKNEELYSGKRIPDYVLVEAKDEVLSNLAECFLKIQRKEDDTRSAVEQISEFYRTSKKFQIRRFIPIVYQKLGEAYAETAEFEKVREVYTELLRRYPNYEHAPYITGKIIGILEIMSQNGEFEGEEQELIEQQLYEERKNMFYRYGKGTSWYDKMKLRIEAQVKGITLPFEERSLSKEGFNPKVLIAADSLGKESLFKNIIDGVTKGQLFDGSIKPPLGKLISLDDQKAKNFYNQAVEDIDNYLAVYPAYDKKSYYVAFQKAQILQFKLNQPMEAVRSYLRLSQSYAYDSILVSINDPNSPVVSYRKRGLDQAYTILEEITREKKIGFFTPGLDTISVIPDSPLPMKVEEILLVEVLNAYTKLFPHDTVGFKASQNLAKLYSIKGYRKRFSDLAGRLALYYPVQPPFIDILAILASQSYKSGRFKEAEFFAKGIYYVPQIKDETENKKKKEKNKELRAFAYRLIGSSITAVAKKYSEAKFYLKAAQEYERAVVEVPNWSEAPLVAQLAAKNYTNAGQTTQAIKMSRKLISISKNIKQKLIGYSGLLYAYQKENRLDSVTSILEQISDDYLEDSASLSEKSLFDAIRISEQAGAYDQAVRISNKYIKRYPTSEKTYKVVFNKINLSKLMGDTRGVFDAYGDFADRYKDSPLSVEAYFRRGDFAQERGEVPSALKEYKKAFERNKTLLDKKKNNLFASEALFRLKLKDFEDYLATDIQVEIPKAIFEQNKSKGKSKGKTKKSKSKKDAKVSFDATQKNNLYKRVKDDLLEQIKLGSLRALLSYYRAAKISEILAASYLQKIPFLQTYTNNQGLFIPSIKLTESIAKANVEASYFYTKSGQDFLSVWDKMKKQKKTLDKEIAKAKDENASSIIELKITEKSYSEMKQLINEVKLKKKTFEDIIVPLEKSNAKWILNTSSPIPIDIIKEVLLIINDLAKDKLVQNMFKGAELVEKNAFLYSSLQVPDEIKNAKINIGKRKNKVSIFVGDIQELNVLSKLIALRLRPFSQKSVIVYDSVISKFKKLGIAYNKVAKAEERFSSILLLPVQKMDSLARAAAKYFKLFDSRYEQRIAKIDAVGGQKKEDVIDLVVNKIKMNQTVQTMSALTTAVLEEYAAAYKTLKELNADDIKLNFVATKASKFVFDMGSESLSSQKQLLLKFKQYNEKANKFFDKDWLSAAATTYDPMQSLYLTLTQSILGQAVILISEYGIQNEYTAKALNLLVETDRAKYLSLLGRDAIKEVTFEGGWKFKLSIPEEDIFDWYLRSYTKADNWNEAIVNDEIKGLQYIVQTSDTTFGLKKYSAKSYWHKSATISPNMLIAEIDSSEGKLDTTLDISQPLPLSVKGDTYDLEIAFTSKDKIRSKDKEKLKEVVALIKKIKVEIIVPINDIKTKSSRRRRQRARKRIRSIINELVKLGADKNLLKRANTKKINRDQDKVTLKVIEVLSDKKDKSKDAGKLYPQKRTISSVYENYGSSLSTQKNSASDFVYMRSSFDFKDAIKFAQVVFAKEASLDSIELYVNDIFVDLASERIMTVDTMSYHYDASKQVIYDVTSKIINGKNTIAIKLPISMTSQGLKFITNLSYYGAITKSQLKSLIKIVLENKEKSKKEMKSQETKTQNIDNVLQN